MTVRELAPFLPLPTWRKRELARYRRLYRLMGGTVSGKICSTLSRLGLAQSESKAYYILCTDPLVIYLGNVMRHLFEMAELLRDRKVTFIKNFYTSMESDERLDELAVAIDHFHTAYPQHRIHFLCATEREYAAFRERGFEPCHFINKNALLDESLFSPMPDVAPEFNAIYNASLLPVKRHELTVDVKRLALICYVAHSMRSDEVVLSYARRVRTMLSSATWLNEWDTLVPPRQIAGLLSRGRVGLCLSAVEGPMAASMEYMLCGLGVVSTRSIGGRDVFFDPEYVVLAEDTPESIARGVDELVGRRIDPKYIRQRTLERIQVHRRRFVELVESIFRESGCPRTFESEFTRLFVNQLRIAAPFPGAFLRHVARGMRVSQCQEMVGNQMC